MSVRAVIGLGFGDEGKGVVTEYLCSQSPENTIVVRFSGGHQAGHKVIKGGIEHVFSSFGSGTLSGCPTYWSKNCTFEPVAFWNEYAALREKGAEPRIYIHPECPVTTIYDVYANRHSTEIQHGTTGTGFYRTKKRHADGVTFTAEQFFHYFKIRILQKLEEIRKYHKIEETLNVELMEEARYRISRQSLFYKGPLLFLERDIPNYEHRVYEGSQGLMLDEHIGYMPHCTPSDLTPRAIPEPVDEIFLVTRAYQTRHGNGPMTNEEHGVKLKNNEKETNVSHKYQGNFRTSILDIDQLIHAKQKGIDATTNAKASLVVTCLDQLSTYRASYRGEVHSFKSGEKFARFVARCLKISGDLYVNDSPYSTTIRKVSHEA
jgi:adenylosuccinate synthase